MNANQLSETALQNIANASAQKFDLLDTMAPMSSDENDREIAQTIIEQIRAFDWVGLGAIGAKSENIIPVERGVLLRNVIVKQSEKSRRWGHIQIILNDLDYYDMTAWTKDSLGFPKKVEFEFENVDFTQLWVLLRRIWE